MEQVRAMEIHMDEANDHHPPHGNNHRRGGEAPVPVAVLVDDDDNDMMDIVVDGPQVLQQARAMNVPRVARATAHISPLLFDMCKMEEATCVDVLSGWSFTQTSCTSIAQHCHNSTEEAFYNAPNARNPLHEACLRNACIHVVQALLEAHPLGVLERDTAGNTPLHLVFVDFSYRSVNPKEVDAIVSLLLQDNPTLATCVNGEGSTPLHVLAQAPEIMILPSTLQQLVASDVTCASVVNGSYQTPLSLYCQQRQASVKKAAILCRAYPAALSKVDLGGWTPLHHAAHLLNSSLIQYLVKEDPSVATLGSLTHARIPLHLVCLQHPREEHLPAVRALVEAAPDSIERCDSTRKTPLHILLQPLHNHNHRNDISLDIVRLLVNREVAGTTDAQDSTPLHQACDAACVFEIIHVLLQVHPRAASLKTRKQDTPLHLACAANHSVETVQLLLQASPASLLQKNDYGYTPLHCVCRAYQPKLGIVQALLEQNPNSILQKTHGGETPVHLACSSGAFVNVLQLLTQAHARMSGHDDDKVYDNTLQKKSMRNKIGNTPLHDACFRGTSFEHVETLAKAHPQWIVTTNNAGYTPLQILAKGGRLDERTVTCFARLQGPQVCAVTDSSGHSPLHSCCRSGTSLAAVQSLVRAYPDALHQRTSYGDTPLHLACLRGAHVEVVSYLAQVSSDEKHSPLLQKNTAAQTPIGIAMEDYQGLCRGLNCCVTCSSSTVERERAFQVLAALVKILYYGTSCPVKASLVQACVSLHRRGDVRLDPAFIRRAIHLFPEEVRRTDAEGNYPLHIEAGIPVEKMPLLDPEVSGKCCSGKCHTRAGILDMLLESYPEAVKYRNHSNALVLGLMMSSGRRWNHSFALALRHFPPALHWQSGITDSLLPMTLSKVSKECGADTLFNLISSRPEVVRGGQR